MPQELVRLKADKRGKRIAFLILFLFSLSACITWNMGEMKAALAEWTCLRSVSEKSSKLTCLRLKNGVKWGYGLQ